MCEALREVKHPSLPELDPAQLDSMVERFTGTIDLACEELGARSSTPKTLGGKINASLASRIGESMTTGAAPAAKAGVLSQANEKILDHTAAHTHMDNSASDGTNPSSSREPILGKKQAGALNVAYGRSFMSVCWETSPKRVPGRIMTAGS